MSLVPEWIEADAFVELLRAEVPNFEKIIDFKVASALKPGENYGTNMLRVSIDVKLRDKSIKHLLYMMKVPHDNPMSKQMLELFNVFQIEKHAIKHILPELEQLYRDVGVEIKFGPIGHELPQNPDGNYVIMDDLSTLGFQNAERTGGLDVVHMERVLELLAQYHAASATRVAIKGPYPELYMTGMNTEPGRMLFGTMLQSFKELFLGHLKTYKDGEKYERAINNFFHKLPATIGEIMNYDPSEFNVLLHGDCWCNNVMFKYTQEKKLDDLIFVDFQMPRWSSPALDLLYLIISSAQLDIKLTKFDYFIRYYYGHLITNLKLLNYPKSLPVLRDLCTQMLKYGDYAFVTTLTTMAGVLVDPTDKASTENLLADTADGSDFRNMLYSNQRYKMHISEILPWLYNRGILTDE